jgi:thiamine kinase-like enzyme
MGMNNFENVVPPEKLEAIKKAVYDVFGTSEIDGCKLLKGGFSNTLIYLFVMQHKSYVLRVVMYANIFEDIRREHICTQLASKAGIAPYLYYHNDDAITIIDFIETVPFQMGFASQEQLLTELVKTILSIHSLPLFPKLINFMDGVDILIQQFRELRMFPESITSECFELYGHIQKSYPRYDLDRVSSHNDLNPNNLLFDGNKIWVIDWEMAFESDRYVDLAIIANTFVKDTHHEKIYLTAYFGNKLDKYIIGRFYLMQQVCHVYYAMLMLRFAAEAKPAGFTHNLEMNLLSLPDFHAMIGKQQISLETYDGQLQYGKILINTAVKNMKGKRFRRSIELMYILR